MSGFGAVEVDLAVQIQVIDGKSIWVAVLSVDGKDAALCRGEHRFAFLRRSGLLDAS